ncbi:hypothetical protein RMR10_004765 [Agrobacterium rosae]|uniref:hypothetical protein n=1 Tax=Agrobacterium rosae TaxID=1972867 RepID=UPI002A0D7EAE|nr:hypothetical protein [Agrobacterium rosae]MDX8315565.1 hypothetical protein [Agrobacterium rosae]
MSDLTSKTGDGVHENHYCCIPDCKKWGGFGFARNKAEPVQWWCWEHYPHKGTVKAS